MLKKRFNFLLFNSYLSQQKIVDIKEPFYSGIARNFKKFHNFNTPYSYFTYQ